MKVAKLDPWFMQQIFSQKSVNGRRYTKLKEFHLKWFRYYKSAECKNLKYDWVLYSVAFEIGTVQRSSDLEIEISKLRFYKFRGILVKSN